MKKKLVYIATLCMWVAMAVSFKNAQQPTSAADLHAERSK